MINDDYNDRIRDILDNIPERLILAENGVDPSVQQEYLEYTKHLGFDQYSEEDISTRKYRLLSPNTTIDYDKETLAILAHRGTLEAYRTIERFLETAEEPLKAWGLLALHECRMFFENSLSDQNSGILMTGLGGENNRLRYLFIIRSRNDAALTGIQKETIKRVFSHICDRLNSILEDIQICQYYVQMKVLIPMDVAVAQIIEGGIAECARFGDFLDEDYYVTNVKIPSEAEILRYLREMR